MMMARRLGLNRPQDEQRMLPKYKRHCVNDDYFSEVRPVVSYWAGFLAADGWVRPQTNQVALGLAVEDISHVEAFKEAVSYSGPVRIYTKVGGYANITVEARIVLYGVPRMVADLKQRYGVIARKTLILDAPSELNDDNAVAFIAGYGDGDGCFSNGTFSLAGTEKVLGWVKSIFDRLFPNTRKVESAVIRPNNHGAKCWHYQVSGTRVCKFQASVRSLGLPLMRRKWLVGQEAI